MAAEPSLPFDQVETSGSVLQDEGLQPDTDDKTDSQFYATLLTNSGDLDRIDQGQDSPAVELIEETDFGSQAILIAQTAWGSGSITPHLKRIEDTDNGIHAYGCYRWPCVWTDDYTERTVVARFERPDSLTVGTVSLTTDAETRVNFRTDEGIVRTD